MAFNIFGGQKELVLRLLLLVFHLYCQDDSLLLPKKLYMYTANVLEDYRYRLDRKNAFSQISYSGV